MENKNWIFLGGAIALIAFILYRNKSESILSIIKSTEPESNAPIPQSAGIDRIIDRLEDYDGYAATSKAAVWVTLFVHCPYWKAFLKDQYSIYAGRETMEYSAYHFHVARQFVAAGIDIRAKFQKCGNTYTREAGNRDYNNVG